MPLYFRNTYKTRKIMLLYGFISVISVSFCAGGVLLLFIFQPWWLFFITGLLFVLFFLSFFMLVLENNNYKLNHWCKKKEFNSLYNELVNKYKIGNKRYLKQIKKIAKDCFYQYGVIEESNMIKVLVFEQWLDKQARLKKEEMTSENKFDLFLYILLLCAWGKVNFKNNVSTLFDMYDREELILMIDSCECIKEVFKDKCMFIYDSPSFASSEFLENMYIELIYVIQYHIGLITKEEFEELLYNPNYYYSEDKKIAYFMDYQNHKYNVYENNIAMESGVRLIEECESKEEASELIKVRLEEAREIDVR